MKLLLLIILFWALLLACVAGVIFFAANNRPDHVAKCILGFFFIGRALWSLHGRRTIIIERAELLRMYHR